MQTPNDINLPLWNQFGASMEMLQNVIKTCPKSVWLGTSNYAYLAFHTVFWTDFYLSVNPDFFEPLSPFTLSEFDTHSNNKKELYSQKQILDYLVYCRKKAESFIGALNPETINLRWKNDYKDYSYLEIVLYNLRHLQHHTAQLNLLLRSNTNTAAAWVSQ
jgi:hypothetical protein